MPEGKITESYSDERTVAMQRQTIELHDSASILVKLSLRTGKGIVEIDPVKFTLDHPDDGTKAHYGLDASEISHEEQALCISMAIDLRDGYSRDFELEKSTITQLDSEKITTITKGKLRSPDIAESSIEIITPQVSTGVTKEEVISAEKSNQMMESFVHVECQEYKEKGSCNHLNDLVTFMTTSPSEDVAKSRLESASLDDYHHKECSLFNKYKMCNHLEKLLYSILDGEIEVTGIQVDKKPAAPAPRAASAAAEEDDELKFEDFVHKNCQEYRQLGACNHMNEIFQYVAGNPPDAEINAYLDNADLDSYHHSNCPVFQAEGRCDHLRGIVVSIRRGDIEIEGIEVDGKVSKPPTRMPADEEEWTLLKSKDQESAPPVPAVDTEVDAKKAAEKEKKLQDEQARKAAEKIEKKRRDAEDKARQEEEEAKQKRADEKARKKAEAKAREEAFERERLEKEEKARLAAEAKAAKERADAERRAAEEAEKLKIEDEARAAAEKAAAEAAAAEAAAELERQRAAADLAAMQEAEELAERAAAEASEEEKAVAEAAARKAKVAAAGAAAEQARLAAEQKAEHERVEAERQAILESVQADKAELESRLRAESLERDRVEEEERLEIEEEERLAAEAERLRDEADAAARAERDAEALKFQEEAAKRTAAESEAARIQGEKDRIKRIEMDNIAMQAKERALAEAAEKAKAQQAQQAEAKVDITLKFVDDDTARTRGLNREVRDFCPEFCAEFDRHATCEHVDETALSAFINEAGVRRVVDDVPDNDAACSDDKLKTLCRQATKDEMTPKVDASIRIVLRVKKRKIAEREAVEALQKAELKFGETHKESGRWDTEVRDFCPEGCREFEKYATCFHVDRISLDDFKHPGCEEYEETNTCSHLREAFAALPDNDDELPRNVLEVAMSQFKHLDCQDDRDHGHCDHLVRLALRAKKRKATERTLIDEDVTCFHEECIDFKTARNCNHVQEGYLDNFKKLHCEESESDHLVKLNKYVQAQNSHKDAIQVISALHLNNYEYTGPKTLEKNPDFTSIARILTRISAATPRPRDASLTKIVCHGLCTEWRLTGICDHIDAELLEHFAVNKESGVETTGTVADIVSSVKASATHSDALTIINAVHPNSWRHTGGILPLDDPKTADIKNIVSRISWRWPRAKDDTGARILCSHGCAEYARIALCAHVDEALTKSYEHLHCDTYAQTAKCGHLYHTVEKIKLEPSHRLASKLIARLDLSEYQVKGGVDFNEHRNCNELIKVLRRISQRWDRKLNMEPEMPLTPTCPEYCLEFARYMTCTHAYDRALDQFSNSRGDSEVIRQMMIEISEMGPETTDEQIRDICDKYSHKDCKEYRETGRCKHLYTIANRVRQRVHINYDPNRAKVSGEFCVYMCDEAKTSPICVHMDGKKMRRFGHHKCQEFNTSGVCKCLIELFAYIREERFSTDSLTLFNSRNSEFYHIGCLQFRKHNSCDHLDDILMRAVDRFDSENRYDEWFHRGCDVYKSGEICQHMRESKLDEFHHKSCDDAKVYGKCYHAYEFVAQWKPDYNGFEYLRRTFPNEFDKFYHDRCNDYAKFGACHHKAEKQFSCFKRKDGAEGNLKQLVYDFMLTDSEGEWEVERWYEFHGKEFKEYYHDRCALAEIYGSCDHLLDLLCEWKYKYTSDLKVIDYNDRKYEPNFHEACNKYMRDGVCVHIEDPKFEKWSHRGCLDYGRYGTCNHLRDGVLMWRAKFRDEYNADAKATRYVRREYSFRKEPDTEEDEMFFKRKERKPWDVEEVVVKKHYGQIQDDPNLDKIKNIDMTFKKLMKRTYEIEADYKAGVAARSRGVGSSVRESGHTLTEIRDRVHNLLRKQENITSKFKDLDDEYYYEMM